MKYWQHILCTLTLGVSSHAQTALYHSGNMQIHDNGNLGFHTHFINNAPFDKNLGLVGFYSNQNLEVSGTNVPLLHDVEIMAETGLDLNLGLDVANNTNFVLGNINGPKNNTDIVYHFASFGSTYTSDGNLKKVNGYAAFTNQNSFIFPVGDESTLRPLTLNSENTTLFATCAYFSENPNAPLSFGTSFNTNNVTRDLETVSNTEFWHLESSTVAKISLSWDASTNMARLTNDYEKIVVAGWSAANQRWENLKVTEVMGSLEQGFVTSEPFLPNSYEVIALAISKSPFRPLERSIVSLDNYFVSPNGDGINDTFYIPELRETPNNQVHIYDRYGLKIFEKTNYIDEFSGTPNTGTFSFGKGQGLPGGIYFYTIDITDSRLTYQGFIYLSNN